MYGFGISGYRSFGPDVQFIAPLTKINIFVGQNNVGKSNVLRALTGVSRLSNNPRDTVIETDADHRGERSAPYEIALPVPLDLERLEAHLRRASANFADQQWAIDVAAQLIRTLPLQAQNAAWWSVRPPQREEFQSPLAKQYSAVQDSRSGRVTVSGIDAHLISRLWSLVCQRQQGDLMRHHLPELFGALSPFSKTPLPEIHRIEPHRQIGPAPATGNGLNGEGLIQKLKVLQRPGYRTRSTDLAKFERINDFLRIVTGVDQARLEITEADSELLVEIDGKILPIADLGTGIHEVVIFAAAATAFDNVIMCLEEPEIHLHPRLQRRLLAYLRDNTTNQYFITTHSAHLLDCKDASVFHVQLNEYKETTVTLIESPGHRASACFDLGYRPSDLVQANSIIWVEGPSDRIYVNAWLKAIAPELAEGEHYSVMFYGGRLLAHLEVSDQDITDFIELQRLNRRVAILIDSDCGNSKEELRSSKTRVIAETTAHGGFAWVTAGREIENYVPQQTMAAVLNEVHPRTKFKPNRGTWLCAYETVDNSRAFADKLRIARAAVKSIDWTVLDLRQRVEALVKFIRDSNDHHH